MNADTSASGARRQSLWTATKDLPSYGPLDESVRTDVCIVGAGISGLSTAYMLMQAGKSVVVVNDGPIACGMTQMTTAHLSSAIDDRYYELVRLHGDGKARLAAESHAAAIDRIESIARDEHIDCEFERLDGYLFLPPGQDEQLLDREFAAARQAGLVDVRKVPRAPLTGFDSGPCLRFPRQGQFHPLRYLAGLAEAITRGGGRIFTGARADEIDGGPPVRVKVGAHAITANAVVVATNTPINDRFAIHTKQAPYMTYVIGARVPAGSVARALYWDTARPYHYVRLQGPQGGDPGRGKGAYDVLIVGGEDHKTGQANNAAQRYARLEHWTRARFPQVELVEFTWCGQVMEPVDGLAFIGRNPLDRENVYIATGDSGMGMTHGTIAGMLITDLVLGRENPWERLYDPARKTLAALGAFAKENVNVAVQYTDWLTAGDVRSTDEIACECGAVMRRGARKVAIYRDERGELHEFSATCPHLGCVVRWNSADQTWDCPCHGSHFDRYGKVINGPANQDLTPIRVHAHVGRSP